MKQQTLAMAADHNVHFEKYRKPTRGDKFLATMDKLVSWASCTPAWTRHRADTQRRGDGCKRA